MPTNKLWIEHTERAAWQSVEALRKRLADAEAQAERLAPPIEGWAALAAELDRAREQKALAGRSYAELVRELLGELAKREASTPAADARNAPPLTPPGREAPRPWAAEDDFTLGDSSAERRLFRRIRRRTRELRRDRRADLNALLAEIETRLEDLPDLDSAELGDIAADLAALFLRLRPDLDPDDE